MSLVEEEYELRKIHISHLGKLAVDLGKQPKKESGIEFGILHQPVGRKDAQDTLSTIGLQKVIDVECRLAEELLGPLALEAQQGPLDGSYAAVGHIPVAGTVFGGVVRNITDHGTEVLEVDKKQPLVVCNAEDDIHHPALDLIKT